MAHSACRLASGTRLRTRPGLAGPRTATGLRLSERTRSFARLLDTRAPGMVWRRRCLPYLFLMGGFHSGSGGLAHALNHHPDIVTTGSSGSQFWAEVRGSSASAAGGPPAALSSRRP